MPSSRIDRLTASGVPSEATNTPLSNLRSSDCISRLFAGGSFENLYRSASPRTVGTRLRPFGFRRSVLTSQIERAELTARIFTLLVQSEHWRGCASSGVELPPPYPVLRTAVAIPAKHCAV